MVISEEYKLFFKRPAAQTCDWPSLNFLACNPQHTFDILTLKIFGLESRFQSQMSKNSKSRKK
jgi:hypothetical protein